MDGQQQLGMIEMQTRYRMSSAGGSGAQLCEIARSIYMYDWQLRVDITSRHAAYHLPLFTGDPAYCTYVCACVLDQHHVCL
jgi:hypothetical protein